MPWAAAVLAIAFWASYATLGVSLRGVPPLLLVGAALTVGGALSLPWAHRWTLNRRTVGMGFVGILGSQLLYVLALRLAPAASVALAVSIWPTLIVVLSPWVRPGVQLRPVHWLAVAAALGGPVLVVLGDGTTGGVALDAQSAAGYACALGSALAWVAYSLSQSRAAGPHGGAGAPQAADLGHASLCSGLVALGLHAGFEPAYAPSVAEWSGLVALGVGPMGIAYYLWSFAVARADTRVLGIMANAVPLLSTGLLIATGHSLYSGRLMVACALVGGATLITVLARGGGGARSVPA